MSKADREVILYNNSTTIEFEPAANFIKNYHSKMYSEEEQLLDVYCVSFILDFRQ